MAYFGGVRSQGSLDLKLSFGKNFKEEIGATRPGCPIVLFPF